MMGDLRYVLLFIALIKIASSESVDKKEEKSGKVISLFNVVKFQHSTCQSTSSISAGSGTETFRDGTCLTQDQCSTEGGTAAGNCASGFGVCCTFTSETCGSDITQNCTYIRNDGFPAAFNAASAPNCAFNIMKAQDDVCSIRLDFTMFSILGPADTTEVVCRDMFTITNVESTNTLPVICGTNTGEHLYLEVGSAASSMATLTFNFDAAVGDRRFEIKTTQITCNDQNRPPPGCLQYMTASTGQIKTFNFDGNAHLLSQNYNVCIRQTAGSCCISYEVCTEPTANVGKFFSLSTTGVTAVNTPAGTDSGCTLDYIQIEGSSTTCSINKNLSNKFCGVRFSAVPSAAKGINSPVCDCTPPFQVGVVTDAAVDDAASIIGNMGVCLMYRQIPCSSPR